MKRGLTALVGAALLLAGLPGTVGAARVTRFTDHDVSVSCESPVDGGYLYLFADHSEVFGEYAELNAWDDPAIPFEEAPSAFGSTDSVTLDEGDPIAVSASWTLADPDGNELGAGSMSATLSKVGDPYSDAPFPSGNHHSATVITHQDLAGSATVTVLGTEYADVPCAGSITDLAVHDANPTSFVSSNQGVEINCIWQGEDSAAGLYASSDAFGFFASPFLDSPEGSEFGGDFSGTFDASSLDATVEMFNDAGDDLGTLTATASLTAVGDATTHFLVQQDVLTKLIQQPLAAEGTIDFPTGESFPIDTEHCQADAFVNHVVQSSPKGPKSGTLAPNDTPDGAIALELGTSLNVQTTSTAVYPEVPITTCPQGIGDDLGHTLWYTFQGTGGDVTIDTSGSNFDTVIAVYTRDGDSWTEVGCQDDQGDAQNPISLQALLTVPTDAGVTYYLQAGGFRRFFDPDTAQSGRMRLTIN